MVASFQSLGAAGKVLVIFGIFMILSGIGSIVPGAMLVTTSFSDVRGDPAQGVATEVANAVETALRLPGWFHIGAGSLATLAGLVTVATGFASTPKGCIPTGCNIAVTVGAMALLMVANLVPIWYSLLAKSLEETTENCVDCSDSTISVCATLAANQGAQCWYNKSFWDRYSTLLNVGSIMIAVETTMTVCAFIASIVFCCCGAKPSENDSGPAIGFGGMKGGLGKMNGMGDKFGGISGNMPGGMPEGMPEVPGGMPGAGDVAGMAGMGTEMGEMGGMGGGMNALGDARGRMGEFNSMARGDGDGMMGKLRNAAVDHAEGYAQDKYDEGVERFHDRAFGGMGGGRSGRDRGGGRYDDDDMRGGGGYRDDRDYDDDRRRYSSRSGGGGGRRSGRSSRGPARYDSRGRPSSGRRRPQPAEVVTLDLPPPPQQYDVYTGADAFATPVTHAPPRRVAPPAAVSGASWSKLFPEPR